MPMETDARSVVAVVRCASYDRGEVEAAVRRGIELVGGVEVFATRGERLLLKPNVLVGDPPSRASTTNPEVFRAVARALLDAGVRLVYGDSGGLGRPASTLRRCGIAEVADALGLDEADFETGREVLLPDVSIVKRVPVAAGVLAADGIVSIPKMKTHALMRLTGAVKNLFGCVPGLAKAQLHLRLPDPDHFAHMLVALALLLRPRLNVMDGVVAMEGNGPRSGDPVPMGVLLLSRDPVALDATFARLVGLDPRAVPTNVEGERHGLGVWREDRIRLVGDPIAELERPTFRVERHRALTASRWSLPKRLFAPRPVVLAEACVRCGQCIEACPLAPPAVTWRPLDARHENPPVHDLARCIRCLCCQELCPARAILVRRSFASRLLGGVL